MKTTWLTKALAILLSVLLATPLFVWTTFAEGDGFTRLNTTSALCEPGEQWYNRTALKTATGMQKYTYAYISISEDGNTLKIEYAENGQLVTELRTRDTDPQYFEYLFVLPAFGDPLPTSEDGLADGAYWFDLADLIRLAQLNNSSEATIYMYENAVFRMSVDGTILRMTYTTPDSETPSNRDEFAASPDYLFSFLRQKGVDPNAGFTQLPTSDEGLEDGDYWFDLASLLVSLSESYQQLYSNAQYYLSDDGNTLRISLGTNVDITREENPEFFRYLRQFGVDPNAGFTLLPTSDEGLADGDYWFDAAGFADAAQAEELRTAQYYLSDDGNTIRLITPSLGQLDIARDSDTGTLLFPYLYQVGVDPNAIEGFALLPTSDDGLTDGDYWYDAATLAEVTGDADYLTYLYYLSDDSNTLRIKIDAYTFDVSRTDEYASAYFGNLRQVGVDPYPGFMRLPKSADGLETGAYWYDAAGFAEMANDTSYLRALYYLSNDGNTLRINQSGYTFDITKDSGSAGVYFVYLHKVGEVYTPLPTSEEGLETGDYWFDASGFADAMEDTSYQTASYSLNADAGILCIVKDGETAYYMNSGEYSYYFQFLKQAGVDPNAGFALLPVSADGLNEGDYWFDAVGFGTAIGYTEEEIPEFLAALDCYLSDSGETLRLIVEGYVIDFPADAEDAAEYWAFLHQVHFIPLPTSDEGLEDGDRWYDAAGLAVAVESDDALDAAYYLRDDGNVLRIVVDGEAIDIPKQPDSVVYFYYLRQVGVDPNAGFVLLPTAADGLEVDDYWYDAAALAADAEEENYLQAAFYLSEDGTVLRMIANGLVLDFTQDDADMWGYLQQVQANPNAGFTLLPTSDAGLSDGDYWYDTTSLNVIAEGAFAQAQFYLSDDGSTLRIVIDGETHDVTQNDSEGEVFFMFLYQVGVDPNAGFVQLPTSSEGLNVGDYWFDAAQLAADEDDETYLLADYYLSEDGTTLRLSYLGYKEDVRRADDDMYFSYLHRIGESADAAYVTMTAPSKPVHAGDTVTVTVDLVRNPGLAGMTLSLVYDTDVLTLTNAQAQGMMTTGNRMLGGDLTAVPYNILWDDATSHENHTETGTILTLTFTVKDGSAAGTTAVTLTYDADSTFDVDLQSVPIVINGTAITIAEHTPGDVDGDGELGLDDAAALIRYLAGGWNVTIDDINADVNGDNSVDLKDAVLIRRYLAGGWGVTLV